MRKVIFQMMITLDGFFEGPNQEIDWHRVDNEFNHYAIDLLSNVDTLLFGRKTYELMSAYWPTEQAITDDPLVAGKMNHLNKIVFSRNLETVGWNNTQLVNENVIEEIANLKQKEGKDITVFGSSDLALTLIENGLIDEYRIIVNPIILGSGKTLFSDLSKPLQLKLFKSRLFKSGNVLLYYHPLYNH
jgi:dihydrofolate reductase